MIHGLPRPEDAYYIYIYIINEIIIFYIIYEIIYCIYIYIQDGK